MQKSKITKLLCLVLSLLMILSAAPLTASAATALELYQELQKLPNETQILYLDADVQAYVNEAKAAAKDALENDPSQITNAYTLCMRANDTILKTPIKCDCGSDAYEFAAAWGIPCDFTPGSHTFVNNVCTVCGSCDHNYFHNKCTRCGAYHPDFVVDENGVLTGYTGAGGDLIIPDGIKAIGDNAFYNNDIFTSVTIPASVESIGLNAFIYDHRLSYVYFLPGSKLKTIENYAFCQCGEDDYDYTGLKMHMFVPESVTSSMYTGTSDTPFVHCKKIYLHLDWDSADEIVDCGNLKRATGYSFYITVPTGTLELYEATGWVNARSLTEHTHSFTGAYFDLGDGTHCQLCECCLYGGTTKHTYVNGVCACGAVEPPKHTHTFENGVCTDCGFRCTHTFENHVCTVCGMADKITAGDLSGIVNGQKFVNSNGIVLSQIVIANYFLVNTPSGTIIITDTSTEISVTSYGYCLTSTGTGTQGTFTNVIEYYMDGNDLSKIVVSGTSNALYSGEYYLYHPVTEVSVKDATCTENGVNTAYWICTDEGCGKAFTDVSCKTEISAETLATYIIPATGHDFTGEYVPGTGDNVGKHARKCVNTGCTAVGLEDTENAYEACIGMEDDFTCDKCGYVDEAAAAAAALAAAKTEAKATVNALAEGASDAVKAIVEKAVEDIDAAESESAITIIVANAESKVAVQKELEAVIAAKKADLTTALASAWTDDAKAILNKALTDIETATTITQANTISSSALGQAQGKDNEFNNLLNTYKNVLTTNLSGNALAAADNYLDTVIPTLEACTNTTDLSAAYQATLPSMQYYVAMAGIDHHYDYLNDFDGITDETKALAADAIEVLRTAKDLDEYNELCAEYDEKVYLAAVIDNTLFALNEFIVTEDDSDEVTAIIEKAVADIKAAESQDEVITAYLDAAAAVEAQRQAEAEALAEAKAEAAAAVELLGTGDDSDEVAAIIEKALADIENAKNIAAVEAIAETAAEDVADQRAAEALAEAKAEAKAAIEALAADDDSDEVTAIIEKALADIEDAEDIAAVEAIVDAAEKDVADQRAAEALAEAKADAKTAVEALAADGDSDEVAAIIEDALADIEAAASIDEVNQILADAKAAVAELAEEEDDTPFGDICPRCGRPHNHNWIGEIFCFFFRLIDSIKSIFVK